MKNAITDKVVFIVFLMIVLFISINKRLDQYRYWKQHKEIYFVNNIPAMTTLDAYDWIRMAREYKNGEYFTKKNLNSYPNPHPKLKFIPLLPWLLVKFSFLFNGNIYYTGIYLIPVLASLFIIPFAIYFYFNGFTIGGLLGGLIGTFSFAYYVRSCTGRVDTDALNIFFPVMTSLLIFLIGKYQSKILKYLLSALAGLSMLLFHYWYWHDGIIPVFLFFMILYLFLIKIEKKDILICSSLYILFSNPIFFYNGISGILGFLGSYFSVSQGEKISNSIVLPNILQTITETRKESFGEALKFILGNTFLSFLGLIVISGIIIWKWKNFIPILPVFFLGLMVFKSSNRFGMFLAPFIGAGIGIIIDLILKYIWTIFKYKKIYKEIIAGILSLILFFILSPQTGYSYIPGPSVPPDIYRVFLTLKKKLPKDSAIYTWWDFGYAIMDTTGLRTFHDGGVHGGWRTYLIAKSFVSHSQKELYNIISFFDNNKMPLITKMIKDNKSAEDILKYIKNFNKPIKNPHIYILFTRDMIGKYGAINFIGNWNFNTKKGGFDGYSQLGCYGIKGDKILCGQYTIDVKNGLLNKAPIKKIVFIKNGIKILEKTYPYSSDLYIEILFLGNRIFKTYLVDKDVFYSNFNQMYLLGNYNRKFFKEVMYFYPTARLFNVLKNR